MGKRMLALALAALLLMLLLSLAGHAVRHLGHRHDCETCPVCVVLYGWEKLLRQLLRAAVVLFALRALAFVRTTFLSFVCAAEACCPTPMGLKVKLSN